MYSHQNQQKSGNRTNSSMNRKISGYQPGRKLQMDQQIGSRPTKTFEQVQPKSSIQGQRPNSKIQPRGFNNGAPSIPKSIFGPPPINNHETSAQEAKQEQKQAMADQIMALKQKLESMSRIVKTKDQNIEQQRSVILNLRKKNYEIRSKITEIDDEERKQKENKRHRSGSRRRQEENGGGHDMDDTVRQIQMAMQLQNQEAKRREREMMMQVLMSSMAEASGQAEAEEERLLQQAIEESKQGLNLEPNVEEMTYEQILELEEKNGKVSKGLKPQQIRRIPEITWMNQTDIEEENCLICFDNFKKYDKIKQLKTCKHGFHTQCVQKWLHDEKRCPTCNCEVET